MPIRIHCKTGSLSARLVFETRAKCQDFVARFTEDGPPFAVDSPFCNTSATILVRQSKSPEDKSPEDREIGMFWFQNYKRFFLVTMPKAVSWFLLLLYEHKSSAYTIVEMELRNRFSVLSRADTNRNLMSLLMVCANLTFLMMFCSSLFVKRALRVTIAALSLPHLFAAWRVEAFFSLRHSLLVALVTRFLFVRTSLPT